MSEDELPEVDPAIGQPHWSHYTDEQKASRARDWEELKQSKRDFRRLEERLLSIGGDSVSGDGPRLVPWAELLDRGIAFQDGRKAKRVEGKRGHCYYNCYSYAGNGRDYDTWEYDIFWGFALGSNGEWVAHAWVRDKATGELLETTRRRVAYFGMVLDPNETEELRRWDETGEATGWF